MFIVYLLIGLPLILAVPPASSPPIIQPPLYPPTQSPLLSNNLNLEDNQCEYTNCMDLFKLCVPSTCTDICKNGNGDLSLTIIDIGCGLLYQVYTEFGKLDSLYQVDSISDSYNTIIYADQHSIIWIENQDTIKFLHFARLWEIRTKSVPQMSIFIEFDNCNKWVYAIDNQNHLVTIAENEPPTKPRLIPGPSNLLDAAIDFHNQILYIARKQNGIRIQSASLIDWLFTDVIPLKSFDDPVLVKVNPIDSQLYVSSGQMLMIIETNTNTILDTIDTSCLIQSFDFDFNFFYFSCEGYKNISKIDRKNNDDYTILSFTEDFFELPPLIYKTKEVNEEVCTTPPPPPTQPPPTSTSTIETTIIDNSIEITLPPERIPFWVIPVAAGGGGLFLLIIAIIIIACLCCNQRKSTNSRPPLPPDFSGLRISDKMTEDNFYSDLEVYETTPKLKKKNINDEGTESIYVDIISPTQYAAPDYENLNNTSSEMDETKNL